MTLDDITRANAIISDGEATEDASWFVDNSNELLSGWKMAIDEVMRMRLALFSRCNEMRAVPPLDCGHLEQFSDWIDNLLNKDVKHGH